ncbi:hypothetical protein AUC70_11750 [Methyloceanibacter stevinii]|uniref:Bacteriophage Mu GpT domain-containing protein n=1 Tax=Methyloceanibacter stevinii TaxID=1774970 RepID=A0A1E3VJ47_9HYPH|nr:Mu-like prophage major head subunit gpT family protein [Methyloceanibacter stevinii]ODR93532.1 hypothetical protein AUC70_11750 [Methyloceanibacter stevinii]
MLVTNKNLESLRVGFKTLFQNAFDVAPSQYERVATVVPSTRGEEKYGWMGQIPMVREWFGDRVVQNLMEHDYAIKNKDFELTLGVNRNHIEDDSLGIYNPLFQEMGRATKAHPDLLTFSLLKDGFSTACYDGQYFFDTDHPVLDADGKETSVANTDGGAGQPWFLLDVSRALKPVIFQKRKDFEFVARDQLTDENVFSKKEFQYGVDARNNVGLGLWQFAWGSKQALTSAYYKAARTGLMGMKGDYGRPLGLLSGGVKPLLVVGPSNESAGLKLLNSENAAGGETNEWKGTAELLVVPWLA